MKGHCATKNILKKAACVFGSDNSTPDVQINNMILNVLLKPSVGIGGKLSYTIPRIAFEANVQAQGVCHTPVVDLCNLLSNYKQTIKKTLTKEMKKAFVDNDTRKQIVDEIQEQLKDEDIGNIQAIKIQGNELVIWHVKKINNRGMRTLR